MKDLSSLLNRNLRLSAGTVRTSKRRAEHGSWTSRGWSDFFDGVRPRVDNQRGEEPGMQRGSLKAVLHRGLKMWRLQWREKGRGRTRIRPQSPTQFSAELARATNDYRRRLVNQRQRLPRTLLRRALPKPRELGETKAQAKPIRPPSSSRCFSSDLSSLRRPDKPDKTNASH
jgi:hypothetical protein